jgi:hypothetical protein
MKLWPSSSSCYTACPAGAKGQSGALSSTLRKLLRACRACRERAHTHRSALARFVRVPLLVVGSPYATLRASTCPQVLCELLIPGMHPPPGQAAWVEPTSGMYTIRGILSSGPDPSNCNGAGELAHELHDPLPGAPGSNPLCRPHNLVLIQPLRPGLALPHTCTTHALVAPTRHVHSSRQDALRLPQLGAGLLNGHLGCRDEQLWTANRASRECRLE